MCHEHSRTDHRVVDCTAVTCVWTAAMQQRLQTPANIYVTVYNERISMTTDNMTQVSKNISTALEFQENKRF